MLKRSKNKLLHIIVAIVAFVLFSTASITIANASPRYEQVLHNQISTFAVTPCGGKGPDQYTPAIDIGCQSKGNPIMDATFGIIHFLSDGVGLVIIASLVWAGIQFTSSRGDPQATTQSIKRIRSNVMALFIFIFAYALLNYVVPGQVLK